MERIRHRPIRPYRGRNPSRSGPGALDGYQTMLDFSDNTRYAGRLWSDKSVFAYGSLDNLGDRTAEWDGETLTLTNALDGVDGTVKLNDDFLHAYSVLGSSLVINQHAPLDVMFAIDLSGSGDIAPLIFQTLMTASCYKTAVESYYASSGTTGI